MVHSGHDDEKVGRWLMAVWDFMKGQIQEARQEASAEVSVIRGYSRSAR